MIPTFPLMKRAFFVGECALVHVPSFWMNSRPNSTCLGLRFASCDLPDTPLVLFLSKYSRISLPLLGVTDLRNAIALPISHKGTNAKPSIMPQKLRASSALY
ncbi:unnamed protein product [Gordionus sp. m RMFG-2023]